MSRYLFGFASPAAQIAFAILFIVFWGSESVIASRSRARGADRTDDRGSLRVIAIVFALAWWTGIALIRVPHASFGGARVFDLGVLLMAGGQLLRWWSIAILGRLFTVTVCIREDHRLVDKGPYRLVRHPAYTALLLVHVGAGLCFGNVLTLIVLAVPIAAALLYRMHVEEGVLVHELGPSYVEYMSRTRRLIPLVY
ncbi:MAG: methyltransferase family protein [Steroidobacteraceae bacterium]